MSPDSSLLCLDIGQKRIGVARANPIALLPEALTTLTNDATFVPAIEKLIKEHHGVILVVGLPRSLDGQETSQTKYTREFTKKLSKKITIPIVFHDEALSSLEAKEILKDAKGRVEKEKIDAEAAASILRSFIESNRGKINELI